MDGRITHQQEIYAIVNQSEGPNCTYASRTRDIATLQGFLGDAQDLSYYEVASIMVTMSMVGQGTLPLSEIAESAHTCLQLCDAAQREDPREITSMAWMRSRAQLILSRVDTVSAQVTAAVAASSITSPNGNGYLPIRSGQTAHHSSLNGARGSQSSRAATTHRPRGSTYSSSGRGRGYGGNHGRSRGTAGGSHSARGPTSHQPRGSMGPSRGHGRSNARGGQGNNSHTPAVTTSTATFDANYQHFIGHATTNEVEGDGSFESSSGGNYGDYDRRNPDDDMDEDHQSSTYGDDLDDAEYRVGDDGLSYPM